MSKRNRRVGSIKSELLKKSQEAALAAVQIFNNPNISFKSESYVVLMIISRFSIHYHTQLWQSLDAKNPAKGYGIVVAGKSWLWYEGWLGAVREHCQKNKVLYS